MKKPTVRSHYLPQTYLKHFLHENELFMYKKGEKFFTDPSTIPTERILPVKGEAGLKNIGVENNLYNPDLDGINSDVLEEIFQELGENDYDATIAAIRELPVGSIIPATVKDPLCLLMASLRVRTPLFKKELEEMDEQTKKHLMSLSYERMSVKEVQQHAKEATGQKITPEFAKDLKDSFVNKKYTLKYPNAYFIKHALLLVEEHVDIFQQMRMTIIKSTGRYFVTNDSPLVYFVPPQHVDFYNPPKGLVTPYCEVFFPLTKDLAVHMCWRKGAQEIRGASRELIDATNYNLAHNSLDYIFAPMKIKELEKFTKEHIPYPFRFAIH
ncbi:MAG: hypothetical protein JWN90_16 [Parcubacteria group bacterium]|nr:hypothetical protein [Parcubacteria group bacterium]